MNLNDYFDHIYCINLDSRPDRWEQCLVEFEKHGIVNVERVSAITPEQVMQGNHQISVKLGEAGLILTHIKIIEDAKEKGYESILILEDDVEFADTIHSCLTNIPENWDLIYFGGNHALGLPTRINDSIAIANRTLAMHCVGIKKNAWELMMPRVTLSFPIDLIYANNMYMLNSYVFTPSQAWQRPSYSDLMGHFVDYGFLK